MEKSKYDNIVINAAAKNPELVRFLYNFLLQVQSGNREIYQAAEYLTQMIETAAGNGTTKSLTSLNFSNIPASENAPTTNTTTLKGTPVSKSYPSLKQYLEEK